MYALMLAVSYFQYLIYFWKFECILVYFITIDFLSSRIYQSLEYIEDNATVFHAYYLAAIANTEMKNSVALGHFVLPPACLQKG